MKWVLIHLFSKVSVKMTYGLCRWNGKGVCKCCHKQWELRPSHFVLEIWRLIPIGVEETILNHFVRNKMIQSFFLVTGGKLMGSMQIIVGIWFFLMDLKGEVTGSRGGRAIIMTRMKATSISMFFTSLALRRGRGIRERNGGQGVAEGKTLRVTTCRGNERKNEKELERGRERRGVSTGRSKEERRGGIALSLLLVTPSQLPGFMERFLSRCCFLIDIKMHWPVCQFSSSPCLLTVTTPLTLHLLNSLCLTYSGCHLHTVWRNRNGTLNSRLGSSCDGQQSPPIRTV